MSEEEFVATQMQEADLLHQKRALHDGMDEFKDKYPEELASFYEEERDLSALRDIEIQKTKV